MFKKTITKKVFLFLIALIGFAGMKAQTCTTPVTVTTDGIWRGQDSFNVAERWHIFHADHDNFKLKLYIKNYSLGSFAVDMFINNCSSLTAITQTVSAVGDSVTVLTESLTIGSDYLIRLTNTIPPAYMVYNLEIERWKLYTQASLGCFSTDCGAPTNTCELVCNGSFECLNSPVSSLTQINNAGNWTSANNASPDLFVTGGLSGNYGIPCNAMGTQAAFTGTNYAGIFINQGNGGIYSEYLETELQQYMVAGQKYMISFYVSLADRSYNQINNIGVYLSTGQIGDPGTTLLTNSVSGMATSSSLLNDVNNWHQVSFCYTALGNERYLTIGSAANTSSVFTLPPNISPCNNTYGPINFNGGYAYIDEVSVRSLQIDAGPDVGACNQSSVSGTMAAQVICGSSIPYTYAWSPTTGLSSSTILNPTYNVTTTTQYNLVAIAIDSQNNYCAVADQVNVVVGTAPGLGVFTTLQNVCTNLGQSAVLSVAPSYPPNFYGNNYTWQPGTLSGNSVTVTPTSPTVYTVTATYGACTTTASIAIGTFSNCCTNTVNALTTTYIVPGTYGDIVINNDLNFGGVNAVYTFTGNVLIAPNVQLTVSNINNQVNFSHAHLYACADMWRGIKIIDYNQVVCTKGTLFEDALIGIQAVNTGSYSTYPIPNCINVQQTVFNKNLISIEADGFKLFGVGTTYPFNITDNVFTCRNLTFTPTSWPTSTVTSLKALCTSTISEGAPYLNASCSPYFAPVNLKAPYATRPSHIAIHLINVGSTYNSGTSTQYNGIQIGDGVNASRFNIFDNHGCFIYATNSNFYSYNNVFQNTLRYKLSTLPHSPFFGGNAIYSEVMGSLPQFDPLFNSLIDMNPGSNVNPSFGNRFHDCFTGVYASNTFSLNANYASFRSTHQTSGYNTYTVGYQGIVAPGNRYGGYSIYGSTFDNIEAPINIAASTGSYNVGAGVQSGLYTGNISIQNNYMGAATTTSTPIGTNYMAQAISVSAPLSVTWQNVASTGIYINQNNIDRSFRGVSLNGVGVINTSVVNNKINLVDENIVFGLQQGVNVVNSSSVIVAYNTLNSQNTTNTRVTLVYSSINAQPKVYCNTTSNAYKGFEFNSAHTGTTSWKGNSMDTEVQGMTLSGGAVLGAQGSTGNPSDNKWLTTTPWTGLNVGTYVDGSSNAASSKLYVKNSGVYKPANPGYFSIGLSYAVATNTPNTTGTYTCGVDGGGGPPPGFASQNNQTSIGELSSSNAPLEAKYIADNNMYRYLAANPSIKNNNAAYLSFYNSKAGSNMDKFNQVETNLYNGQISQALAVNNSVQTANVVDETYKGFYTLSLKSKSGNFTKVDSTDLITIAALCPDVNGAGVYQARALYNYLYQASLNVPDNCTISIGSRLVSNAEQGTNNLQNNWTVDLFPNPATTDLTIVSKTESENLSVLITDISGKTVYRNSLATSNFIRKLEIDLINGIYLVTIKNTNNESTTKKLVITK